MDHYLLTKHYHELIKQDQVLHKNDGIMIIRMSCYLLYRYILYDVNVGEGFNLRRDVYMRIANTVRQLRQQTDVDDHNNFILVLPPWGDLYHWHVAHPDRLQNRIQWSTFFDVSSLNRFVPVIEFEQYIKG